MKRLRVLVIGYGSIGKRHAANLRALGVSELAVCETETERRILAEAQLGVRTFDQLARALSQRFDAVLVATPPSSHVPIAIAAAEAGCHLFIEKPLSHTEDQVDWLIALARRRGLVTMIGCNMRFHPNLAFMKRFLSEGELGKVYSISAEVGAYLPEWRPGIDYRENYGAQQALGGGVLLDSIHEIDYVRWLLGEIAEVQCFAGRVSDLEIETEDLALILVRFASGALGSLHLDYVQRPYCRGCKIIGERGVLVWDMTEGAVRFYDHRSADWRVLHELAENADMNELYLDELRAFLRAAETGVPVMPDIAEGASVLRWTLKCKELAGLIGVPAHG